jgi:hypothetical protein
VTLTVIYLSRHHWVRVGRAMAGRIADDSDRLLRSAAWMLVAGCGGMVVWLLWAGAGLPWALVFVAVGFMVSVLVARVVAETGMPFIRMTALQPHYLMTMLPAGLLTGAVIYMAGFVRMIFQLGSRVSATVMITHAAALDREASPRHQLRLGYLMIVILLVGLVVCGAVHLAMGYHFTSSLDGVKTPVAQWGSGVLRDAQKQLLVWSRGAWRGPPYNRVAHLCFGVGLAGALQWACLAIPRWPLHPVGLLLVGHYYGNNAWAPILIGWALKMLVVHFGGAAAYRRAAGLFLGIIMGEIFAAILWTLVPVILILCGQDAADVGHILILPT